MKNLYNHSKHTIQETIVVEPTSTTPGRVKSLHATKGWRYTRIDSFESKTHELREKLNLNFNKSMKF